ncbi:alkylation response protein AidB-like acyl-CoA dehydrogenase [Rhizobium subbaraonis]|uniref:Alkylation response protein AidB-like acyl-CoA dehydrogenase n=1 Tax=Rhizobium subbaraonis TaxID=908946 RepID=A0A285UVW5_9HYPH|nr:acyl-CoA dehydrogenase family protein [Rhizobium subbaraonis]SOC45960.1 alkylation response protein AidB-like acyl-CoA dehydrogenase [Rhizobium subbaraonis]
MGKISPALVRTAALIGSEDEAIAAAGSVARHRDETISPAATGGEETVVDSLDALSRSGLFGVSIPTEHGGIDVSNTVLTAICAILSEYSTTVGLIACAHFIALERLRSYGTDGQRSVVFAAAFSGARVARVEAMEAEGAGTLPIAPVGLDFRINGEALCTPRAPHADWLLMPALDATGRPTSLLLPARTDGIRYVANGGAPGEEVASHAERVLFKDVLAEGDVLLHPPRDPSKADVPQALEILLEAARHLGRARRDFLHIRQRVDSGAGAGDVDHAVHAIGAVSVRIAAAEATLEHGGRAVDAAQIGTAERHRTAAVFAAIVAGIAALEAGRLAACTLRRLSDPAWPISQREIELACRIAQLQRMAGSYSAIEDDEI